MGSNIRVVFLKFFSIRHYVMFRYFCALFRESSGVPRIFALFFSRHNPHPGLFGFLVPLRRGPRAVHRHSTHFPSQSRSHNAAEISGHGVLFHGQENSKRQKTSFLFSFRSSPHAPVVPPSRHLHFHLSHVSRASMFFARWPPGGCNSGSR